MRRRLLLAIVNAFKWLAHKFTYLFHSIVPSFNKDGGLPNDYQQVEYIESTGTQYIDTGVVGQSQTDVEINANVSRFEAERIIGARNSEYRYEIYIPSQGAKIRYFYRSEYYDASLELGNHIFSIINGEMKRDGTLIGTGVISFDTGLSLYLFACNNNGTVDFYGLNYKLYSCKMWNNNALVRDFVPCYRKSDKVIGLYDKVNGVFYTNAGTGTFLKGANVEKKSLGVARVKKIEANGEIENQLISISSKENTTLNGITFTNNNDGSYTLNGTATAQTMFIINPQGTFISGNKYLVWGCPAGGSTSTYHLYIDYFGQNDIGKGFITTLNTNLTGLVLKMIVESGTTVNNIKFVPQTTNLTQRYGAGNEPTSLDDPRVQRILAQGVIPFNAGTYKGTKIEMFESEPFNIWDEQWELGIYNSSGAKENNNSAIRSSNYIKVIPNKEYYLKCGNEFASGIIIRQYDKNKNFIGTIAGINNTTFTTIANCEYITFCSYVVDNVITYNHDICINRSSPQNGQYKPHKSPATLLFKYQGNGALNAHDTMEITATEYVFTRNTWNVDLGSQNIQITGSTFYLTNSGLNAKPQTANIMFSNTFDFIGVGSSSSITADKQSYSGTNNIGFRLDSANNNVTTFKSLTSGTIMGFELANPQVIRIPKKHLGMVRLKDLNWTRYNSTSYFYANVNGKAFGNENIYCAIYKTDSANPNKTIKGALSTNEVWAQDTDYNNTTSFKNHFDDQDILFYETADEVADIDTEIAVETGGTLNGLEQRLPREYQEVEYLESSGTQYIDTGIYYLNNTRVVAELAKTNGTQGQYASFFGTVNNSSSNPAFTLFISNNDAQIRGRFGLYNTGETTTILSTVLTTYDKFKIEATTNSLSINGETPITGNMQYGSCPLTIKLFARGGYETPVYQTAYASMKLYYFKMYEGQKLVRDFIPCYRKADKVAGLFDMVNKKFYTNAGAGTFAVGTDITNNYGDCEVLPNVEFEFKVK